MSELQNVLRNAYYTIEKLLDDNKQGKTRRAAQYLLSDLRYQMNKLNRQQGSALTRKEFVDMVHGTAKKQLDSDS